MNFKNLTVSLLLGALVTVGTAQNSFAALTAEQRLLDFDQLVSMLQRNYGPLHLKRQSAGLNFEQHVSEFRNKVGGARSDTEFYQLLARFLAGLKDAHVSSMVP